MCRVNQYLGKVPKHCLMSHMKCFHIQIVDNCRSCNKCFNMFLELGGHLQRHGVKSKYFQDFDIKGMVEVLLGGWHEDTVCLITRLARQLTSHTGKEAERSSCLA